jgi:hypothetical protein
VVQIHSPRPFISLESNTLQPSPNWLGFDCQSIRPTTAFLTEARSPSQFFQQLLCRTPRRTGFYRAGLIIARRPAIPALSQREMAMPQKDEEPEESWRNDNSPATGISAQEGKHRGNRFAPVKQRVADIGGVIPRPEESLPRTPVPAVPLPWQRFGELYNLKASPRPIIPRTMPLDPGTKLGHFQPSELRQSRTVGNGNDWISCGGHTWIPAQFRRVLRIKRHTALPTRGRVRFSSRSGSSSKYRGSI